MLLLLAQYAAGSRAGRTVAEPGVAWRMWRNRGGHGLAAAPGLLRAASPTLRAIFSFNALLRDFWGLRESAIDFWGLRESAILIRTA
jgi:hypothetical protein